MRRAALDRKIHAESQREGLLGLWMQSRLQKDRRGLRLEISNQKRHRR
jgi:hypothetical protein